MPLSRPQYIERLLALYRSAPGTTGILRAADRRLAADLFDRDIPLDLVHLALRLAVARRQRHDGGQPPTRINSLHYFLPLLDELTDPAVDPAYLEYLRHRLLPSTAQPGALTDHRAS